MQAVITVVGVDKVGILAKVSGLCAEHGANIEEVTQTILRGTFAMIMLVTFPAGATSVEKLAAALHTAGEELGVDINLTRTELIDSMHQI